MDMEEYNKVSELERKGEIEKGFTLLQNLANDGHPLALLELGLRFYSTEGYVHPVKSLESNLKECEELLKKGKQGLEKEASLNDGEAMRMLAYTYLGFFSNYLEHDLEKAEEWLLKSYEAGCYFAANDLSTYYLGTDLAKAKFWYQEADKHNCRVIFNDQCET